MKNKDKRIRQMSEILNNIKTVKLYAWEKPFNNIISDIRKEELRLLKRSGYLNSLSDTFWQIAPFMVRDLHNYTNVSKINVIVGTMFVVQFQINFPCQILAHN